MNRHKFLVLSTLFILALVVISVLVTHSRVVLSVGMIDTAGLPTLGKAEAPVQMVVFEDLRCAECQHFQLNVFPEIQKRYIETGRVQCALVLLAFLDDSEPLAQAALSVFETHPAQFFSFVGTLYQNLPAEGANLDAFYQMMAEKYPGVSMEQLKNAAASAQLMRTLKTNEDLGDRLMKGDIATPTIFINGVEARSHTINFLSKAIDKAKR